METIQKRFFNLLALVKYVLESKASIPFPEEENTRPYKKPYGYEWYTEDDDRRDFVTLEDGVQREVGEKIKTFHYLRNKVEESSRSIIHLSNTKGGQITITLALLYLLIRVLELQGVKITYKKLKNIGYKLPNLAKPRGFIKRKNVAELYRLTLEYENSKIYISMLSYSSSDMPLVSFVENTIEDNDGEKVFKKMEQEIDRIIRLIPIVDIFGSKDLILWFFESYGIFLC